MKNIHLLKTDKPSRLRIGDNGNFVIANFEQSSVRSKNDSYTNQHLYITSDEEINKGYWCLDIGNITWYKVVKFDSKQIDYGRLWKKIILTTDQDLIKDGVQAIDDEFLEWFVKNPSCEFVEVEELGPGFPAGIYWINYLPEHFEKSIPQEEPKQEKEEEYFKHLEKDKKEFAKEWEEIRQEFGFGKKDTLEEAAENHQKGGYEWQNEKRKSFIAGANWQSERMYSEEEVFSILDKVFHMYASNHRKDAKDWFEQFKKK